MIGVWGESKDFPSGLDLVKISSCFAIVSRFVNKYCFVLGLLGSLPSR